MLEGRVCEEPKPMQIEVDGFHGQLGGGMETRNVKRKGYKKMVRSRVDASNGQLGGGLETEQAKRKRVDKMVQSRDDASHGQLGGGPETHQVKRKRGNKRDASDFHGKTYISVELEYAKIVLDFYEKRQDAKFEILEVLFSNLATLVVPGFEGVGPWCHVSFIAKPKNSDCCGKHFFGEMMMDHASKKYNVTYCSIFEPSDPGNISGCVFCPDTGIFLHPPDGCPAGGREIDKFMAQKGTNASQGQVRGCSKRHRGRPKQYAIVSASAYEKIKKAEKAMYLKYAKIALEFYENSKDAKFQIVKAIQSVSKRVVVPGSESIEECCHVSFTAKPRNVDCIDSTPKHFFGELLRDATTGKYNAAYCEMFKPSDRKVAHNCIICPRHMKHPSEGYRVGRPPYSREGSYMDDLELYLNLHLKL